MQLEYNLTAEDYIRFNEYHLAHSPMVRRNKWFFFVLPPLAGCVAGLLTPTHIMARVITLLLLFIIWPCFAFLYWPASIRHRLRKFMREGDNTTHFGKHIISISPDGLEEMSNAAKNSVKWKGVTKLVSAEHGIYLYNSAVSAYIVPNSAFTSETQREEFLETTMRYREQAAGLIETL